MCAHVALDEVERQLLAAKRPPDVDADVQRGGRAVMNAELAVTASAADSGPGERARERAHWPKTNRVRWWKI